MKDKKMHLSPIGYQPQVVRTNNKAVAFKSIPQMRAATKMAKAVTKNPNVGKKILIGVVGFIGSLLGVKAAETVKTQEVQEVKESARTVENIKAENVESWQELLEKAIEIEKIKLNQVEENAEKKLYEERAAAMDEYEAACPDSEDKETNEKIKNLQPKEVAEYRSNKIYAEAEEKKQLIYNETEDKYQSNQITYSEYEAVKRKARSKEKAARHKAYDQCKYVNHEHYYLNEKLKDKYSSARKKYNEKCEKAGEKYNSTLKRAQTEYQNSIAAYRSILMEKADKTPMTVRNGLNKIREEYTQAKQILDKAEISDIKNYGTTLTFNSNGIDYILKNDSSENVNLYKTLVQIANGETIPDGIKLRDSLFKYDCDWNLGANTKITKQLCKVLEYKPKIAENKILNGLLENHIKSMKDEEILEFLKQYKQLTLKTATGRRFLLSLKDTNPHLLIDIITPEELYKSAPGKEILKQYKPSVYEDLEYEDKKRKRLNSYVPSLTEIYRSSNHNYDTGPLGLGGDNSFLNSTRTTYFSNGYTSSLYIDKH